MEMVIEIAEGGSAPRLNPVPLTPYPHTPFIEKKGTALTCLLKNITSLF